MEWDEMDFIIYHSIPLIFQKFEQRNHIPYHSIPSYIFHQYKQSLKRVPMIIIQISVNKKYTNMSINILKNCIKIIVIIEIRKKQSKFVYGLDQLCYLSFTRIRIIKDGWTRTVKGI